MSRVGRKPLKIPGNVQVNLSGGILTISGPKGTLTKRIPPKVAVVVQGGEIKVSVVDNVRKTLALWGLYRNLISNMIVGVERGFEKDLELSGIGLKVKKEGSDLIFSLGFSHPVRFPAVPGIDFEVKEDNKLTIKGADRELVGQEAARIRNLKVPEPYKGKGIKYRGEMIRRKSGKVGKVGASLGAK